MAKDRDRSTISRAFSAFWLWRTTKPVRPACPGEPPHDKWRLSHECVKRFLARWMSLYRPSANTVSTQASAVAGSDARLWSVSRFFLSGKWRSKAFLNGAGTSRRMRRCSPLGVDFRGSNDRRSNSYASVPPQYRRPNAAAHRSRAVIAVPVAQRTWAMSIMSEWWPCTGVG